MSIVGGLGLGFGPAGGGGCDYPLASDVRLGVVFNFGGTTGTLGIPAQSVVLLGVGYGANNTEFFGTFNPSSVAPSGGVSVPVPVDDIGLQKPLPGTANQGVTIWRLLSALKPYLMLVSGLGERDVRLWLEPTRPQLGGRDMFLWFRPTLETPSKSLGPGRWGNRTDIRIDLHLVTRTFVDESQVDERRARGWYDIYFKLENSLQGVNLFNAYAAPEILKGVWHPPQPANKKAFPLTVEPMYLEEIPVAERTQREEGTLEAAFRLTLPAVLSLTVP